MNTLPPFNQSLPHYLQCNLLTTMTSFISISSPSPCTPLHTKGFPYIRFDITQYAQVRELSFTTSTQGCGQGKNGGPKVTAPQTVLTYQCLIPPPPPIHPLKLHFYMPGSYFMWLPHKPLLEWRVAVCVWVCGCARARVCVCVCVCVFSYPCASFFFNSVISTSYE